MSDLDRKSRNRAWSSVSNAPGETAKQRQDRLYGNEGYTPEDRIQSSDRSEKGCWSHFAGCIGGMWATRQLTKKEDREVYVKTTLRELIVYAIFLGVFCFITFAQTTYTMFYYTKVMSDLLLDAPYPVTKNTFKGSNQVIDFWRFSENVLLDALYWENWYDPPKSITAMEDRNILYENRLLGVPRMRQIRVRNDSCQVPEEFQKTILSCYALYSEENEDKSKFGLGTPPAWTYQTAEETGAQDSWGKISTYSGAGSYIEFGLTRNKTANILSELRENLWITRHTSVIFLDFTVYNANLNLFCIVKLIVEFPPTGGIIPSYSFRTVKLLRYVTPMDYFIMGCEIIFLFFVFYYIVEEALEISSLRLEYFKSVWNVLDLIVIGLSVICIVYNIYNYIIITPTLQRLLNPPDQYANFEELGYWHVQFNSIVAVCVFFAWFKLFKYISFNKTMTQLSSTLSRCSKDVAGFAVMFFIVFFAFSQLGYLLFGSQVYDFHTFIDSVFTLLRTILGDFNFREMEDANRVLGPIFFICYVFFVFFVLLNMFLAIINDTYSEVKAEIALQRNEFEIGDFFKQRYNDILGKVGSRDRILDFENVIKNSVRQDGSLSYDQARAALKKFNFSQHEIEDFFGRYDMDGSGEMEKGEVDNLLDDLEGKRKSLLNNTEPPAMKQERVPSGRSRPGTASPSKVLVQITDDEYQVSNRRLDGLEQQVAQFTDRIDLMISHVRRMEKSQQKKKEALSNIIDELMVDKEDEDAVKNNSVEFPMKHKK